MNLYLDYLNEIENLSNKIDYIEYKFNTLNTMDIEYNYFNNFILDKIYTPILNIYDDNYKISKIIHKFKYNNNLYINTLKNSKRCIGILNRLVLLYSKIVKF